MKIENATKMVKLLYKYIFRFFIAGGLFFVVYSVVKGGYSLITIRSYRFDVLMDVMALGLTIKLLSNIFQKISVFEKIGMVCISPFIFLFFARIGQGYREFYIMKTANRHEYSAVMILRNKYEFNNHGQYYAYFIDFLEPNEN